MSEDGGGVAVADNNVYGWYAAVEDAQKLKDTGYALQGATVNGVYDNGTVIDSSKTLNSVVGHEVVHAMEGSDFYAPLRDAVVAYAKKTGEYDTRLKAIKELYTGKPGYETDFDSKAERELVADLIGDYVFSDPEFVRNLSVSNRNLFQKIYDEIMYLAKVATAGSKEARALEKVKKTFENVYRDTKNTAQPDGVKYSLGEYSDVQKNNWSKSNKIIIYENDAQLLKFVRDAITNKDASQKMYFGVITGQLSERIKADAGLDFEGKNAVLRASNVRKILLHDHGNVETESQRGQIAVTENDFLVIKDIFGYPDTIKNEPQGYKGKPAATFEKTIGNKKYTMFVVDSGGSLDIFVQTMYIHKKRGSIANVANAKALTSTSETSVGTAPTNKVQQNNSNVNGKMSLSTNHKDVLQKDNNAYGRDVAVEEAPQVEYGKLAPTKEDIALMEQEKAAQSEDGMQTLIRGLDEIRIFPNVVVVFTIFLW